MSFVLEGKDALSIDDLVDVLGSEQEAEAHEAFEVLDVDFKALPGFSRADCIHVDQAGLKQPVAWGGSTTIKSCIQTIYGLSGYSIAQELLLPANFVCFFWSLHRRIKSPSLRLP